MEMANNPHVVELLRDGGDAFRTTRVEAVANWARKYSLFVQPFASSCCEPELVAAAGPRYDLERFGCTLPGYTPRQSDLLMVLGTLTRRQVPLLRRAWAEMPEPRWVMALGACACSGGPYDNYATVPGVEGIVPVDVFVPGCPPRPEALIDGLRKLQARIQAEHVPAQGRHAAAPGRSAPEGP